MKCCDKLQGFGKDHVLALKSCFSRQKHDDFSVQTPKESNGVVTKSYLNLIGVPFFFLTSESDSSPTQLM